MKFNKILLGLAAVAPFALASCNNAVTYENIKTWIASHYTHKPAADHKDDPPAIATFYWDFHATTSDGPGMGIVEDVFTTLSGLAKELGIEEGVIRFPGVKNPIGEEKNVGIVNHIYPFNVEELANLNKDKDYVGHFGRKNLNKDKEWDGTYKETFKIYDNALNVTSTEEFTTTSIGTDPIDVSCTYVYNQEGYLAGYGFKIGRHYVNSSNIVKLKVTVEFEYSH